MTKFCPHCGQLLHSSSAITIEALMQACADQNFPVHLDMVRETAAAYLLDRSVSTLQNWRAEGAGPRYQRTGNRRGKIYYSLQSLADYLNQEPL